MPVKKSKAKPNGSDRRYALCEVKFRRDGVVMQFDPKEATKTREGFNEFISHRKKAGKFHGLSVRLQNGKIKDHVKQVSKKLPTKLAFCLEANSTWKFIQPGFEAGNPAHKSRFSDAAISGNGKVVETTFTPDGMVKNYPYNLWVEADVLGTNGKKAPTVTIIVDPVVRSSLVP